jgi:hypothetical protein
MVQKMYPFAIATLSERVPFFEPPFPAELQTFSLELPVYYYTGKKRRFVECVIFVVKQTIKDE